MKYKKDFEEWNIKKQIIEKNEKDRNFWFEEREIWWCSFGVNIGVEIDGKSNDFNRPALIIKVFNKEGLYVLPITTKDKEDKFHFQLNNFDKIKDNFNAVVLTQLKFISSRRLLRKIGRVPEDDFQIIKKRIMEFL
ncbi:type II toxin-antitoxin system PemK/MazF family toxin [Patescibacteria group bacterium]|nr:type II toxin-antitoxin system PemK/MazF family toxin [Patescibacteria group bacterium]